MENDAEGDYLEEDVTCCHRVTIFPAAIRNIVVTKPVITTRFGLGSITWAKLFHYATVATIVTISWAVLYFILNDTMLPGNDGFGLYVLAIFSSWLGWGLSSIPYLQLPPVFGMLLAGLIVRNSGFYNIHEELGVATTSKIRTFCLTFIMIRSGLQLSTTSLTKHTIFILILAIVPCTVEVLVLSVCCRYVLSYHWDWSVMAGTIISCMSPVITMNSILALAERGYGEDNGLATILSTAACIDVVHVISLFTICYSIVFANDKCGSEWWYYVMSVCVRDTILGIVTGILLGTWFVFVPHRSHKYSNWFRMICLVLGSLMFTTFTAKLTISGGGYLATLVASFVCMLGWRILTVSFDSIYFRRAIHVIWRLVQPILVGVIGADIELVNWCPSRFGLHLLCILIGLMGRSAAAYLTTWRTSFTWKERLFVVISWLPKGSVQAALGPMAYEHLRNEKFSEELEMAEDIVKVSVVTILFLSPIGASLISRTGPILLSRATEEQRQREREMSYLRILSFLPTPVQPLTTNHQQNL
ncbi:sodium/hydrogen exchanger 9B1-like isoform X2 [Frieseomelitta varia]|uniref:sodium/hydrogen exchanger 9B1-like isoform X2 n=1 Tax=Frieseomelitta varia TaxID=561572 RepID=UPI001CB688CD|nr:sodium/hydrogen exchanger 9B1-like isoform X2 [Frieseomelitta varia]